VTAFKSSSGSFAPAISLIECIPKLAKPISRVSIPNPAEAQAKKLANLWTGESGEE